MHLSDHGRVAWALARRQLVASLLAPGPYLALSLCMLAALLPVQSYADQLAELRVLAAARPFDIPLLAAVIVAGGYLGLSSTVAIVRDYERGTLETLFFGPVKAQGYLAGHFLAQFMLSALILGCFGLYLLGLGMATGLAFSWGLLASLVAALWTSLGVIAFGILISTVVQKTRGAVLFFLLAIGLLVGIQVAATLLANLPAARSQWEVGVVATAVAGLQSIVRWLSPFSYLVDGLAAAEGSAGQYALALAEATVYALACAGLAVFCLQRRGVRP
jgi:ABC-type transport system involved in multi-copper enzyme maturation permease subunit